MDCGIECIGVGEGLMREMMRLEVAPTASMSFSSGAYLGSHSTVSQ